MTANQKRTMDILTAHDQLGRTDSYITDEYEAELFVSQFYTVGLEKALLKYKYLKAKAEEAKMVYLRLKRNKYTSDRKAKQ